MKYAVLGPDGQIRQVGLCQDEAVDLIDLQPGETLLQNAQVNINHQSRKVFYVNGAFEDRGPVFEPTYVDRRKGAYPSIGDQLDMLWHAMDTGQIPKAQQFYNALKAVKDKFPKNGG